MYAVRGFTSQNSLKNTLKLLNMTLILLNLILLIYDLFLEFSPLALRDSMERQFHDEHNKHTLISLILLNMYPSRLFYVLIFRKNGIILNHLHERYIYTKRCFMVNTD